MDVELISNQTFTETDDSNIFEGVYGYIGTTVVLCLAMLLYILQTFCLCFCI